MHSHLNQSTTFGPLLSKCMRDNKPQNNVSQHKPLKVTRNATNQRKHINEASKPTFANNFFKMSCKNTQRMFSKWKICFNVNKIQTYHELLCNLNEIIKLYIQRPVLTSQFDVSKLQKQLQKLIQFYLDQSSNFGPLISLVCVTVNHNVAFNNITR